jgi:hypothetical protein
VPDETQPKRTNEAKRTVNIFSICAILFIVFQALNSGVDFWTETRRTEARDDIQRLLTIIERRTSPEADAQQAEVVNQLVVTLDCQTRVALEEALLQAGYIIDITPEETCV